MTEDPKWEALCKVLDCGLDASLDEVIEAAEELRAEADIQLAQIQVTGQQAGAMRSVVDAALAVYHELVRLGRYQPNESPDAYAALRSDRWSPEVDLFAAVDKYLTGKVVSA